MLQILVNNTPLILDPKTQIRYEVNFPYFETDAIPTGTIWQFDIPAPGNEAVFGYANYVIVGKKYRMYDCVVKLHSYPIARGKLVLDLAGSPFRASLTLNEIGVVYQDYKLTDLDASYQLGTTQTERLQNAVSANQYEGLFPFKFPMIYAPAFYGDNNDAGLPKNNPAYLRYLNNFVDGEFVFNNLNSSRNALVPCPKLVEVIDLILKSKDWELWGDFANDAYIKKLLMHSNTSLDMPLPDYMASTMLTNDFRIQPGRLKLNRVTRDDTDTFFDGFYTVPEDGRYQIYGQIDFFWSTRTYDMERNIHAVYYQIEWMRNDQMIHYQYRQSSAEYFTADYLPENAHTIEAVPGDKLWLRVEVDAVPSDLGAVTVYALTSTYINFKRYFSKVNKHRDTVILKDHLPDMNFTTLLNTIRLGFGAAIFFDNEFKRVQLQLMNTILANRYGVDITPYVVEGSEEIELPDDTDNEYAFGAETDMVQVIKYNRDFGYEMPTYVLQSGFFGLARRERTIYESVVDSNTSKLVWKFKSQVFEKHNEGGSNPVSLDFVPCAMASFKDVEERPMPYFEEEGRSPYNEKTDVAPLDLTLSAWDGIQAGYPRATSMATGTVAKTLNFNGTNTLDDYVGPFNDFQGKREEVRVRLSGLSIWEMLDLLKLNMPSQDTKHPRWVLYKSVKFLPKQFTFVIDVDGNVADAEAIIVKKREE